MEYSLNPFPALAVSYQVDSAFRHASNHSKGMSANPFAQKLADVYHLLASKFVRWLVFAFCTNQASLPRVLRIPGQAYPFQIDGAIVGLVAVDVINAQAFGITWAVRKCNEPMSQDTNSATVCAHVYAKVSRMVNLRRIPLLWNVLCQNLFNTKPNSAVGHIPGRNLDVPQRTHYERDTVIFKRFPAFHNAPLVCKFVSISGGSR